MARILYVSQTFLPKFGGAERYIHMLAEAMAKRGHEVYVLAPFKPDIETSPVKEGRGFNYSVIRTDFYDRYKMGIMYFLRAYPMALKLAKFIKANKIDVVHFQYINPFAIPTGILKLSGARIFATVHGSGLHFMMGDWLGRKILPRVLKNLDGVIAVSDYCAELVMKAGGKRDNLYVVYNGTDPDEFKSSTKTADDPIILTVCRLVPRKDVKTLLKALKYIKSMFRDARLIVVGDGPDRPKLENMCAEMGLKDSVDFLGHVPDCELKDLYAKAKVFVLPAIYDAEGRDVEGFGIVLLEAMASMRPVIGANVGGIPSAIKGPWGLLYEPGNWRDLGEKIAYILSHPEEGKRMGMEGREAVKRIYNWNHIAERVESIYGVP